MIIRLIILIFLHAMAQNFRHGDDSVYLVEALSVILNTTLRGV